MSADSVMAGAASGWLQANDPSVPKNASNAPNIIYGGTEANGWADARVGEPPPMPVGGYQPNPSNPFSKNFTGVQPGTGAGTGYSAVNVTNGKTVDPQNPWTQFTDVTGATKDAQSQIAGLQGQLKDAQNSYPAMENTYGLGGPVAPAQQGADANPGYDAKPITSDAGSSGSRGFNPWSLQGEATARNSWG